MRGARSFCQGGKQPGQRFYLCPQLILQFTEEVLEHMNVPENNLKSIIRWCKPVHLIVIDLVDSGACSGRKILTSLVYVRYNVSTGLAAVCGNL